MVYAAPFTYRKGACGTGGSNRAVSAIRYYSKKILVFSDFSNSQNRACKLRLDLEMYTSRLTLRLSAPLMKLVQRLELLELDFSDDGLNGAQRWNVWNG